MPESRLTEQIGVVSGRNVSRETVERLQTYELLLREEASNQNLISSSTLADLWSRHILDSAQLVRFAPPSAGSWVDIGTGAGLPGIVVACLTGCPVTMIEPRRLRAEFLHKVVARIGLKAEVVQKRVQTVRGQYDVITARAVAALPKLLEISAHLSTTNTVWALPKGRNAAAELEDAKKSWHGLFHVEQSVTDPESRIIVASGVAKK